MSDGRWTLLNFITSLIVVVIIVTTFNTWPPACESNTRGFACVAFNPCTRIAIHYSAWLCLVNFPLLTLGAYLVVWTTTHPHKPFSLAEEQTQKSSTKMIFICQSDLAAHISRYVSPPAKVVCLQHNDEWWNVTIKFPGIYTTSSRSGRFPANEWIF